MQGASQVKLTAARWSVVTLQSDRRNSPSPRPSGAAAVEAARELGHVRRRARLYVGCDPAGYRRGREVYRTRLPDGQSNGQGSIAEKGVWPSLQPLPEDLKAGLSGGFRPASKADEVWPGIVAERTSWRRSTRHQDGVGHRCAVLPRAGAATREQFLASLVRWYSPDDERWPLATSTNAELLALSGKRQSLSGKTPASSEQGALADLLLVDGNPLDNINLIADPPRISRSSGAAPISSPSSPSRSHRPR